VFDRMLTLSHWRKGTSNGISSRRAMRAMFVFTSALALAGCATRAADISAAYVSPIQYQSYSCNQLREEAARVSNRAAVASGAQDQNATSDAVATGVAVVLFWPVALMVHGNGANAQEVATLKGDMDAIEQANIQKKCGIQIQRALSHSH
jgi:hypothetical protein